MTSFPKRSRLRTVFRGARAPGKRGDHAIEQRERQRGAHSAQEGAARQTLLQHNTHSYCLLVGVFAAGLVVTLLALSVMAPRTG